MLPLPSHHIIAHSCYHSKHILHRASTHILAGSGARFPWCLQKAVRTVPHIQVSAILLIGKKHAVNTAVDFDSHVKDDLYRLQEGAEDDHLRTKHSWLAPYTVCQHECCNRLGMVSMRKPHVVRHLTPQKYSIMYL